MLLSLLMVAMLQRGDIVIADFEGDIYGSWVMTGSAFGNGPARGTLPNQMSVSRYEGRGLVNTFLGGDGSTGTLTSPEFRIERRYLAFLIGGGYDPQRLRLELLVDGRAVRTATGPNRVPGGSEALAPDGWDVSAFEGKTARIRIVDEATGGWGHLNVDHLVLTDRKPPMSKMNVKRTLAAEGRYLHLPIRNGAPARQVTIQVEGKPPVTNTVELADGSADWVTSVDLGLAKGRKVTVTVDQLPDASRALDAVVTSDRPAGSVAPYEEAGRAQFHFSARRGWLNDPNGLVFYRGEYHLFFQHNPYGWGWGNMHWGHAVSKDLVHWEELPIALSPDPMGTMFSGSAVVDGKNASGLGKPGQPPMLLFYTAAGSPFVQGLAYSVDGRTFKKWKGNPIVGSLATGDRDPKVVWHEPTQKWVMALYLEIPNKPTIQFLGSTDFKTWTPLSRIEGYHECPDLFELPIKGLPGESRWILTGANSDYQVGTFDGTVFHPETPILKGHRGKGFYAAQTFSDTPGRRIQIGWFQTETKGMPFNQSMSIPMELGLITTPAGPRLTWSPVPELQTLVRDTRAIGPLNLASESDAVRFGDVELAEIELDFVPQGEEGFELSVRGIPVVYEAKTQELNVAGTRSPAPTPVNGRQSIRIFCDRTGIEVFASNGQTFIPMPIAPSPDDRKVGLRVKSGTLNMQSLKVHRLESAWKNPR